MNKVKITYTAPDGRSLEQTVPVVWCGKAVLLDTLDALQADGCTNIEVHELDVEVRPKGNFSGRWHS